MPGFPPVLAERIVRFLSTGKTGNITLDVKEGRVLGYKIVECWRVGQDERERDPEPAALDRSGRIGHDAR